MTSDLAASLRIHKGPLHQAAPKAGDKYGSYETASTEPTVDAGKEAALSFMERVLVGHTVTRAAEDMTVTNVESDINDTDHKPQQPLKLWLSRRLTQGARSRMY